MKKTPLACTSGALIAASLLVSLPGTAGATVAKATAKPVLAVRSSGNGTTHKFKITSAPWKLAFAFQCITQSQFGFQVKHSGASKADHTEVGSGFAQSGTAKYKDTGTFTITVKSADHCEWLLKATQSPAT